MRAAVLTVDQRGPARPPPPTGSRDASPALADVAAAAPFERTVGDEFQGVLDDPAALALRGRAAAARRRLEHRHRHRRGRGAAARPAPAPAAAPPTSTPATRSPAAKTSPWHLRVDRRRPRSPRPGDHAVALGRGAGPAYLPRLGGRRPGRRRGVVRRGRASGSASASLRSASARRPPGSSRAGAPASWPPTSPAACSEDGTDGRPLDERGDTTQLVLALLGFALVAGALGWTRAGRRDLAAGLAGAAGRGRGRRGGGRRPRRRRVATTLLVALAGALAVAGGGPVTTRSSPSSTLRAADTAPDDESLDRAGAPATCSAAAPGSARSSGSRSSPASSPAGPRASPSCWRSRASAATRPPPRPGPHRHRRAVHHRHLHQRALGRGLCRDRGATLR